mmetsp:Transcript_28959/g.73365  ORF Transcript_28959/g.73365 Transcript_28959/m.73365 type:complete len:564 (-) Transcript_28959:243-1934(-)
MVHDMEFSLVQGYLDVRSLAMSKLVCKGLVEHATYLQSRPHYVTALSTAGDLPTALSEAVSQCSALPFLPNIGFLFLSDEYLARGGGGAPDLSAASDAIETAFRGLLPPSLALVGCTGSGIIGQHSTGGVTEIEHGSAPALSLALAHVANCDIEVRSPGPTQYLYEAKVVQRPIPAQAVSILSKEQLNTCMSALEGRFKAGPGAKCVRAVCLADIRTERGNDRLEHLLDRMGSVFPDVEVTGGLASAASSGRSYTYTRPSGAAGSFNRDCITCALFCTACPASQHSSTVTASCSHSAEKDGAERSATKALPLTHACVARNVIATGHKFAVVRCTKNPDMEILRLMGMNNAIKFEMLAPVGEEGDSMTAGLCFERVKDALGGNVGSVRHVAVSCDSEASPWELAVMPILAITQDGHLLVEGSGHEDDADGKTFGEGSVLHFMMDSASESMADDVSEQLIWTKQRLSRMDGFGNRSSGAEEGSGGNVSGDGWTCVRGGLLFACSGRGSAMYGRANVDSKAFRDAFPSSRGVCGFFCTGEIGPTHIGSTITQIHGFTSVYTLFEGV